MKALIDALRHSLKEAGLLRPDARLLCGVSGGCDSVALLHALCALQKEIPFSVFVCHVQHDLRGESSRQDEQFVRRLCSKLGVALQVENAGLNGSMHTPGMETLARERRRMIFLSQMERLSADALLTAHHRDDQAETVLMHLLRGSGMEGLCGMKPLSAFGRGVLLRPFLSLSKEQLASAVSDYCEDGSNFEPVTPRNILRLNILPELERLYPGASEHIANTAQTLAADEACLSAQAEAIYQSALYSIPPLFALKKEPLVHSPEALVRRVLRRWWQDGSKLAGLSPDEHSLSRSDTLQLFSLIDQPAGTCCNLPSNLAAQAGTVFLYLMHQSGEPLASSEAFCFPPVQAPVNLSHLSIHQESASGELPHSTKEIILTPELLALEPVFRPIRPDDRIHPFGAPGSKPLRRFLIDRKIDLPLRSALTVLACGSDVWWIPSLCTAELLRLNTIPDGSVRLRGAHSFLPH
ncbi:MAG: tRNA lysidine(34) synthetase TilS [Clostridia bacterium]|nr:tRNA lysidine(34) synthetase TilS [Clostridia bacterium]